MQKKTAYALIFLGAGMVLLGLSLPLGAGSAALLAGGLVTFGIGGGLRK